MSEADPAIGRPPESLVIGSVMAERVTHGHEHIAMPGRHNAEDPSNVTHDYAFLRRLPGDQ